MATTPADRGAEWPDARASQSATGDTGDTGDNSAAPSSPPSPVTGDALGTPGTLFRVDGKGVWHDDGEGDPAWICSELRVTALTRNQDGEAWGRLLEFRDPDRRLHRWACPMEMLSGDGAAFRAALLHQGLSIAPSNRARQRLAEYVQTARPRASATCTDRTGWHGDVYVLPDATLGEGAERVILQTPGEPPRMRTAGTAQEWRDRLGVLCQGNSRLLLAVSAAFAAPLLELIGDESGGIHLVGGSSTGKTTALRLAASVWGGPEYLHRWRATANGLEAVAVTHNDALLVLDELAQVDPREAGAIAYMLANGTGKHRARQDGLPRPPAAWRLLFLSAGEVGLSDHMASIGKRSKAGQEVRLVDVPADAGVGHGLYEALHGYAGGGALSDAIIYGTRELYGAPARAYLPALVDMDRERLLQHLRLARDSFVRDVLPEGAGGQAGQAGRVAARFGLVAAAGELATKLGLTGWERDEATRGAATCYQAWLGRRGGAGAHEDAEAVAQVRHFIEAHGSARFQDYEAASDRPIPNRAGYRRHTERGTEYLITPEVFRREVCAGLDYRHVARVLRERGMLVTEAPDRLTIKPRGIGRVYAVLDDGGEHGN